MKIYKGKILHIHGQKVRVMMVRTNGELQLAISGATRHFEVGKTFPIGDDRYRTIRTWNGGKLGIARKVVSHY